MAKVVSMGPNRQRAMPQSQKSWPKLVLLVAFELVGLRCVVDPHAAVLMKQLPYANIKELLMSLRSSLLR